MSRNTRFHMAVGLAVVGCGIWLGGCKSKATKQAEEAEKDLQRITLIVDDKYVGMIERAIPAAASVAATKASGDVRLSAKEIGGAVVEMQKKNEDVRSGKRSYYALVAPDGEAVWVDDPSWPVVGRKLDMGFAPVGDALAGKGLSRGTGRFGGSGDDALSFITATTVTSNGKTVGAFAALWEAHDAAEDLQRQLVVDHAMELPALPAKKNSREKAKDKARVAMELPELWVCFFRGTNLYCPDDTSQPLLEVVKTLDLPTKTASASWRGTFDVGNVTWGGAAGRVPKLGADIGLTVLRRQP